MQTNPFHTTNLADSEAGDSYIHFHVTFIQTTSISSLSKGISFSAKRMLFIFLFSKVKINYTAPHNDVSISLENVISSMSGNFFHDC